MAISINNLSAQADNPDVVDYLSTEADIRRLFNNQTITFQDLDNSRKDVTTEAEFLNYLKEPQNPLAQKCFTTEELNSLSAQDEKLQTLYQFFYQWRHLNFLDSLYKGDVKTEIDAARPAFNNGFKNTQILPVDYFKGLIGAKGWQISVKYIVLTFSLVFDMFKKILGINQKTSQVINFETYQHRRMLGAALSTSPAEDFAVLANAAQKCVSNAAVKAVSMASSMMSAWPSSYNKPTKSTASQTADESLSSTISSQTQQKKNSL